MRRRRGVGGTRASLWQIQCQGPNLGLCVAGIWHDGPRIARGVSGPPTVGPVLECCPASLASSKAFNTLNGQESQCCFQTGFLTLELFVVYRDNELSAVLTAFHKTSSDLH